MDRDSVEGEFAVDRKQPEPKSARARPGLVFLVVPLANTFGLPGGFSACRLFSGSESLRRFLMGFLRILESFG